jgi:hypothetical protein
MGWNAFVKRIHHCNHCELSNAIYHVFELSHCNVSVTLDLSRNRLTNFDLSLLPKSVQHLDLSVNQLVCLDGIEGDKVIDLPNMIALNVGHNNLTTIPALRAPQLQTIHCETNQLTSLAFLQQDGRVSSKHWWLGKIV